MLFTKDGIIPDLIMNPHAIPSRMTIGQLIECIMGKACLELGTYGDSTAFTDVTVEEIADILESCGMERHGNEIMYNSRTGEQMKTLMFIGPTYYQRLKHMTVDKLHCLTAEHQVQTLNSGWKPIAEVTMEDDVACLKDGKLVYEKPLQVFHYPDYKGKMYAIKNSSIDLDVTINHRMWVSRRNNTWKEHELIEAEKIYKKNVRYQKDATWDAPDYQFVLPAVEGHEEKIFDMDAWLNFFGIWMAEGYTITGNIYKTDVCVNKQRVKDVLYDSVTKLGYKYSVTKGEKLEISSRQLQSYMSTLSVGAPNKFLPDWVWKLSAEQCKKLVYAMCLGDGTFNKNGLWVYYTASTKLSDNFMQLCLHAGWSSTRTVHIEKGTVNIIHGREVITGHDVYRLSVIKTKNKPSVNHGHHQNQEVQEEKIYDYEGPVYCLQVPSEVFYVRRNGKTCWTGNSRSNNGPIVALTRQPSEGRARSGGLRLGQHFGPSEGSKALAIHTLMRETLPRYTATIWRTKVHQRTVVILLPMVKMLC